jgi:hypothetical protein
MACIRPHERLRATILGLAGLLLGACASTSPSPVVYGRAPAVPVPVPESAAPPQQFAQSGWRAPVYSPPPITSFDLPDPYWDESAIPRVFYDQPYSECVPFARRVSGIDIYGDAITWWTQAEGRFPRSGRPVEGSVLSLRGYADPGRGHVAVVKYLLSDRIIRVDHANWLNGGEASFDVPVIDVSPDNDWSAVRVWHVPGGHWGGRVYQTEGFILPFAYPGVS